MALSTIPHPGNGSFITVLTGVVSPMSRVWFPISLVVFCLINILLGGTVTLASNDPFDAPVIDSKLLSHPFDQAAMAQAILDGQTVISYAFSPSDGLELQFVDSLYNSDLPCSMT